MPPSQATTYARAAPPPRHIRFRIPVRRTIPDNFKITHGEDVPDIAPVLGAHVEGYLPVVPGQDPGSFWAAVDKRINYRDDAKLSTSFMDSARRSIREIVGDKKLDTIVYTKELFDAHMSKFGPEKVARMEKALDSIPELSDVLYTSKNVFVKVEALLKRADPVWAPRIIYQGSDVYNALAGPVFGVLMSRLDSLLSAHPCDTIKFSTAYRKNSEAISDWLSFPRPSCFFESDFSGNDKTQVSAVLELELYCLELMGAPKWLLSLHAKTSSFGVSNREHGFKAIVHNQLATGAVDTTYRNCLWNYVLFRTWTYRHSQIRGRVIILGDDMLFVGTVLPRRAVDSYTRHCRRAHMVATCFRNSYWHQVSFLSRHFIEKPGGRAVMIPVIPRLLCRLNVRANFNDSVSDDTWCASKNLSYAYETRHHPWLSVKFQQRAAYHVTLGGQLNTSLLSYHSSLVVNASKDLVAALKTVDNKYCCDENDFCLFLFRRYDLVLSDVEDSLDRIIMDPSPGCVSDESVLVMCRSDL